MMRSTLNGEPVFRRRRIHRRKGQAHHAHETAGVLARAPLAVLMVDCAGVLLTAAGRAAGRLGPLIGGSVFDLAAGMRFVPDDGGPCTAEVALRRALAGEDLAGLVVVNDRVFEARTSTYMRHGASAGVCIVALDVTKRREAEMRSVREDRMGALGTLAAGVANEINNPLTYVLINIDHVMRRLRRLGALNEEEVPSWAALSETLNGLVEALAGASDGANRVRAVTSDVLVFAQGNNAPRGLVDVRAVLESALQVAWHELRHRARIVKQLAEVPPLAASATQLAHVFLQLLVNAASSIPEGNAVNEEVRVSTRCDANGDVVVEIRDTGKGIAAEALPRVFDPFFTTRAVGQGVGLGLSMCHGMVQSMGGRISVESAPGHGTVFRVVLPPGRRPSGHPPKTPPCRMLVVDADPLVGEAIARALGEESELTLASDARQATQLLGHDPFDLVLCDLMLPETSGVDLYVELLRTAPHLVSRIAFMAGGASTARARAFLSSISNPCLEKPLDMSELRRLVVSAGPLR
jgi:signal transduction histidine kinase